MQVLEDAPEVEGFDAMTEEEIDFLWRTFKASGLSDKEAWHAVIIRMALDKALGRSRNIGNS